MNNGDCISVSSDDEPLITFSNLNNYKNQSHLDFDSLIEFNQVFCDFCDETFTNRLDAIIHTKDHIIIPLLRQNYIQCPECLYHFTTLDKFKKHRILSHFVGLQKILRFETDEEDELVPNGVPSPPGVVLVPNGKVPPGIRVSASLNNLYNFGCYRCKYCLMIFNTRFQLLVHTARHLRITQPKMHLCILCEGYHENRSALKDHITHMHNNVEMPNVILNTCTKCNLEYNNFHTHCIRYHRQFYCYECEMPYNTQLGLNIHLKRHDKKVKCQNCGKSMSWIELNAHLEKYHKTRNFCDTCLMFAKNQRSYNSYISVGKKENVGKGRQACSECHKYYLTLNLVRCVRIRSHKITKERKTKTVTNMDRLKNIKVRLKKIKSMGK